jgi:hypothetical protein
MESKARKRGRPRKNGVKDPSFLARALKVLHAYDEARLGGMKHSAAVKESVSFVRNIDPHMPISETEVKRILAELRPSDSPVGLLSSCEVLEGPEAATRRRFFAQMIGKENSADFLSKDPERPLKRFSFGIGKRPNYPRHNGKAPTS